jgi:hypothetical protein
MAHPNWRYGSYPPALQTANLIGLVQATGQAWWPDAIAMLNLVTDPSLEGTPNWRRQVAIEMGNQYSSQVPSDRIPAFLLELDFHHHTSVFWNSCGSPYSLVWVPADWHSMPADEAMEELFTAVRERRVVGTVGDSRFVSCAGTATTLTLELTQPMKHIQLWAGGSDPVATWSNVSTAQYDLAGLNGSEPFVWFFAYGDSVAGNWNTFTCRDKEVLFTSPIIRNGSTFNNQYSDLTGMIPIKVFFHYHTSLSIDGNAAPTFEELLDECRTIGVDAVLTTDHVPHELQGPFPSFVHAWDHVPVTAVWSADVGDAVTEAVEFLPSPIVVGEYASIRYGLSQTARVSLQIYDVHGRLVHDLRDEVKEPGRYSEEVTFSGPGVYFARLRVGSDVYTKKLSVLR